MGAAGVVPPKPNGMLVAVLGVDTFSLEYHGLVVLTPNGVVLPAFGVLVAAGVGLGAGTLLGGIGGVFGPLFPE